MTKQRQSNNNSASQTSTQQNSSSQNQASAASKTNQVEQAYVSSLSTQSGAASVQPQPATQQQPSAASAQQANQAQAMAAETGLDYTSDVIRQEQLKNKNQKAANSLVDRMYWQREESLSKSINVNDKGELEDYDDTPGLGSDKPGV